MELYQLRGFAAIVESGHLTRAAERLHLSQPALSAQLKALEEELGVRLFDRTPGGMVLTAAGKRVLKSANRVLNAAKALKAEARLLRGDLVGRARIGTLSDPAAIRLGEFTALAVERHPSLQIELHQEVTGVALESVARGDLDASFFYGDIDRPDVTGVPLREFVYRVAGPAEWATKMSLAGWNEIAEMPWIVTPPISSHHRLVQRLLQQHGVEPTTTVEADQETVISSLVESGLGIAMMREDVALQKVAAGTVYLWKDVNIRTTLWFIHQRARQDDAILRALLDIQREMWLIDSDAS
ncbi:MAG: LysR family transcriptional regulator [Betaproteobacteria bacterium]|nr:LysR family transcriptional regulator [Betaproteobacteria bacterium]